MRGVGSVMVGVVFLALLILIPRWLGLDASFLRDSTMVSTSAREWHPHHNVSTPPLMPLPFSCGNATAAATCPAEPSLPARPASGGGGDHPAPTCPDYFRYIHDDLRPWRGAGITREAVERGRRHAYFRLVVVSGRAFVETYRRSYQTRDVFTQWGILQLMRRYAGRVPDVDIMFACDDPGQVRAADFAAAPADAPPVFRYCKDKTTLDVVFPDWSFWGWPEVNIGAWPGMLEAVRRENERVRWPEREPFAFWKGNPGVARIRGELMKCNPSNGKDWNARLFTQVQDIHRGQRVVGEREIHPGVRLAGAVRDDAVPGHPLAGARRRRALLADQPHPHVRLHQARRRLGQRPPGGGAADRRAGQPVREGADEHGLRLRLHAAPAHRVRQAAPVQARRAGEGRRDLRRLHGVPGEGPPPGVHGRVRGGVRRRIRALRAAAAVHGGGGQGDRR
ncbi:uncharacterized protein LOC102699415 isoform X2 [Oryza brachyantha]|uniref:uncharacterized protein LOC102699415 isoform X2 n=1 Tax=Oryza brachyantha TaxID=4533 RepID=UPI001ADC7D71|nr:uncharacterized protein LOC102699415 isoform X2 [Oryza brachyantha]